MAVQFADLTSSDWPCLQINLRTGRTPNHRSRSRLPSRNTDSAARRHRGEQRRPDDDWPGSWTFGNVPCRMDGKHETLQRGSRIIDLRSVSTDRRTSSGEKPYWPHGGHRHKMPAGTIRSDTPIGRPAQVAHRHRRFWRGQRGARCQQTIGDDLRRAFTLKERSCLTGIHRRAVEYW